MTGRTSDSQNKPIKDVQSAVDATFDIGELASQLGRVTGTLDELQSDNQVLSDAVVDSQRLLAESRQAETDALNAVTDGRRQIARIKATVDRRDAEIVKLSDELSKIRAEQADWEAVVLAERDAAIEEQTADLAAARLDVRALSDRVSHLEDELALERQRTAPDTHLVQLMTTTGTTLLIDGEDLVHTGWPHLAPERRRSQVIGAAARFHQRHGVDVEVLFAAVDGWDVGSAPAGVRIRVPHEGILIPACLSRLAQAYGTSATPVVTVSSAAAEEPWISTARAADLMGLPVPAISQDNQDLEPATEVEK